MHPDELLEALRREGAALGEALGDDLTPDVAACPGWNLEKLANHVGRVHRWAAEALRDRATGPVPFPGRPDVVDRRWYDEGLAELVTALEEIEPDESVWNFMGQAPQARFWFRRQAHETSVHRWDAQWARAGDLAAAEPIDTELALDGIDELLDVMLPLGYQRGDLGGTVHLHATDSPHGEWLIRTIDGELLVGHDHQKGDAAVRGTASDLLLFLWGRLPADHPTLEVFGDADLAARLREVLKAP